MELAVLAPESLQVWLGYKQSLRPCENGLTLNIDVAATAFLSPDPVLTYLSNILRRPEQALTLDNREDLRKAEKALRSLKVFYRHHLKLLTAASCPVGKCNLLLKQKTISKAVEVHAKAMQC